MTHVTQHRRLSALQATNPSRKKKKNSYRFTLTNRCHVSPITFLSKLEKLGANQFMKERVSLAQIGKNRSVYAGRSVREDGWSNTDCARSAVGALEFDFPPIPLLLDAASIFSPVPRMHPSGSKRGSALME